MKLHLGWTLAITVPWLVVCASCQREARQFHPEPAQVATANVKPLTNFIAGGFATVPAKMSSDQPERTPPHYDESAYAVAQGKLLFTEYNCYGCHAHGGGDMGPPLMDDKWIYGPDPAVIFYSIAAGRPNGMPAFGSKLPAFQIWQLTAYVRSMSGLGSKDAAPGRDDHMETGTPENSRAPQQPRPVLESEQTIYQQLHRYGRDLDPRKVHVPIDKAMEIGSRQSPLKSHRK